MVMGGGGRREDVAACAQCGMQCSFHVPYRPWEAQGFVVLSLVVRVSTVLVAEKGSGCSRNAQTCHGIFSMSVLAQYPSVS